MNDLRENLRREFNEIDYRYAYAQSFLNTKIAAQTRVLREQRGMTQAELAALCGTKQAGFSRFEDVNHSGWKTDTLWKIAKGLGVRVNISFETFGSLIDEKERFTREHLQRHDFEDDPAFAEQITEEIEIADRQADRLQEPALARDQSVETEDYHSAGHRSRSGEPHRMRQPDRVPVARAIDRQQAHWTTVSGREQRRRPEHASAMEFISGNCKSHFGQSYPPAQP